MKIFIFFIILTLLSSTILAGPGGRPPQKFFSTTLGGGVAASQNIRKDNLVEIFGKNYTNKKNIVLPIPIASIKLWRFRTGPQGLTFNTYQHGWWGINTLLSYMGDEYKADLMHSRKKSIFLGIAARIMMFNLTYKRDIESESSGGIFTFNLRHRIPITQNFNFNAILGVSFLSRNYVDYYFGVKSHEEIPIYRPMYYGKSSRIFSIKPGFMYMFTKRFMTRVGGGIDFFTRGIHASPTVTRKTRLSGIAMLMYRI